MFLEKFQNEKHYDKYFDDSLISDYDIDYTGVPEIQLDVADNIFDIIQDIISSEDNNLNEEFSSYKNSYRHYKKHCLDNKNKKSARSYIFYDFNNIEDYLNLESKLSRKIKSKDCLYIDKLFDMERVNETSILNYLNELFKDDKMILFGLSCNFANNNGRVKVAINSKSNNNTTNYSKDTLDFMILAPDNKTISLYLIDADYLKTKLTKELNKLKNL